MQNRKNTILSSLHLTALASQFTANLLCSLLLLFFTPISWAQKSSDVPINLYIYKFKSIDEDERNKAIESLQKIGDPAVPALLKALQNEDMWIRSLAAIAIGRIKKNTKVSFPELIQALKDKEPLVRYSAALALSYIGDRKATSATSILIQALENDSPSVRRRAVLALGNVGKSKTTIPALIKALGDTDESVRYSAASTLNRIALTNISTFNKIVRKSSNIVVLIKALQDKQVSVRYIAVFTLNYIDSSKRTSATPSLIKALQDESPLIRQRAAFALSSTKKANSRVPPALIKALKDKDESVRYSAAYSLNSIGIKTI